MSLKSATIASLIGPDSFYVPKVKTYPELADSSTRVGIEIELENMRYFEDNMISTRWKVINDGSLRNYGKEFILMKDDGGPYFGWSVLKGIRDFEKAIKKYSEEYAPPECSERTSVHIHVDVRDLTISEFKKFILLYYTLEKIFIRWVNPSRECNNYCRTSYIYGDIISRLGQLFSYDDAYFNTIISTGNKYDALNYKATETFGSIEFRLLHGTYDADVILEWINILLALKNASKDSSLDVFKFPEQMSVLGIEKLISNVLGDWGSPLEGIANPTDIIIGLRNAQKILRFKDLENASSTLNKGNSSKPAEAKDKLKTFINYVTENK